MFVITVMFHLNEGCAEAFMPLMQKQAKNSVALEEGCVQFDVIYHDDQPDQVFLYEVYKNEEAFNDHLLTSHYNDFSSAIAPLVKDKSVAKFNQYFAG